MKTMKAMLAFLMVISMVAPAMADVTASAYGSAESGHHGSVSTITSAYVAYNGMMATGEAGAGSSAEGREVLSVSYAGGEIGWQAAEISAGTYASAEGRHSEASAYGYTDATTMGWMSTAVNVNANAESGGHRHGGSVEVGAGVQTDIYRFMWFVTGIGSTGYAGASAGHHGEATVTGNGVAHSYGAPVDAGVQTIAPGENFDMELFGWANVGNVPTPP